jgi:hypothetical protein
LKHGTTAGVARARHAHPQGCRGQEDDVGQAGGDRQVRAFCLTVEDLDLPPLEDHRHWRVRISKAELDPAVDCRRLLGPLENATLDERVDRGGDAAPQRAAEADCRRVGRGHFARLCSGALMVLPTHAAFAPKGAHR